MGNFLFPVAVFFAAIFTDNILLTNYLGMCSFLAVSKELETSAGLGIAVTFVLAVTTPLNWAVYYLVLVPFQLEYLRSYCFLFIYCRLCPTY